MDYHPLSWQWLCLAAKIVARVFQRVTNRYLLNLKCWLSYELSRFMGKGFMLWAGLAVLLCPPVYGQEDLFLTEDRSLYWDALEVTAHLDADGRLHVKERQKMVFDGPWNGGERTFNITVPQELTFKVLSRVMPGTGALVALSPGNLEQVDEYRWFPNSDTLRWRSRLPTDPPFKKTKITYQLEYSYAKILFQDGNFYLLNHDFSFPQREGNIRRFVLKFTWDDKWSPLKPLAKNLVRNNLPPGESVIVQTTFRHHGKVPPLNVIRAVSKKERYTYLVALLVLYLGFFGWFYLYEKFLGWYDAPIPPDNIDEKWLQQFVFSLPPEVVGTKWDEKTNSAEVSALLARLEMEGKLRSQIKNKELHLELLADPKDLQGYEAELVNMLFVDGKHTNTQLLRQHYHHIGFYPANFLHRALRGNTTKLKLTKIPFLWLGILGMGVYGNYLLLDAAYLTESSSLFAPLVTLFMTVFWAFRAAMTGHYYRMDSHYGWNSRTQRWRMVRLLISMLVLPGVVAWVIFSDPFMLPAAAFLGMLLLVATYFGAVFILSQAGINREHVQLRQRLIAARHFFERELSKPAPQLKNEWYPYLIAYELTAEMDHWFNIHAQQTHSPSSSFKDNDSGKETIQTKPAGWTGGGGSFGGGGSTGDWATTAATLVSSIPRPRSSHSSSGGSSRSSSSGSSRSSGGGGGGGW